MRTYKDPQSVSWENEKEPEFIPLWGKYLQEWELLDNEELGELVRAMLEYSFGGTHAHPALQGAGRYLWARQKTDIDYARDSYKKKVASGKKGGRGKKAVAEQPDERENPSAPEAENEKQEKAKESKEKQEQVIQDNKQIQTQKQPQKQPQIQPHPQKENRGILEEVVAAEDKKEDSEYLLGKQVLSRFYEIRDDLERPDFISKQTLQKAQVLGQKYPPSAIGTVFQKSRSGFLNGGGEKGWAASLTWLLEEEHFQDVLEGKYDWSQREKAAPEAPPRKKKTAMAQEQTYRVELGSAGLGEYERQAIQRMLAENGIS